MDRNTPSTTTAFNKLPLELNKAIAEFLTTDKDVDNYRWVCHKTSDAIDGDKLSFWRGLYRKKYALLPGRSNNELKRQYINRAKRLGKKARSLHFTRGHSVAEMKVLDVLKTLINESFKGATTVDLYGRCLNQKVLHNFVMDSRLLLNSRRPSAPKAEEPAHVHLSLSAVKIMCSHFLFDMDATSRQSVVALDDSQKAVYAPTNEAPIFLGPEKNVINMEWILHCLNFFRHYMMNPHVSALHENLRDLGPSQHPSPWQGSLKPGAQKLGSSWKGTYAYLNRAELIKLRLKDDPSNTMFEDLHIDEGKYQSLKLSFPPQDSLTWPRLFEQKLHSQRPTIKPTTRAQQSKKTDLSSSDPASNNNILFQGQGEDLEDQFFATGWLNPLPNQCDIAGWQRVTFMKHFEEDLDDDAALREDNLWAYEGVVVPGGRLILGRWWSANDEVPDFNDDYNGPFILWAVEPEVDFSNESDGSGVDA